jgi:hypothetical protein
MSRRSSVNDLSELDTMLQQAEAEANALSLYRTSTTGGAAPASHHSSHVSTASKSMRPLQARNAVKTDRMEPELPSLSSVVSSMPALLSNGPGRADGAVSLKARAHVNGVAHGVPDAKSDHQHLLDRISFLESALARSQLQGAANANVRISPAVDVSSAELLVVELEMEKKYSSELEAKLEVSETPFAQHNFQDLESLLQKLQKHIDGASGKHSATSKTPADFARNSILEAQLQSAQQELTVLRPRLQEAENRLRAESTQNSSLSASVADLEVALEAETAARKTAEAATSAASKASIVAQKQQHTADMADKTRQIAELQSKLGETETRCGDAERNLDAERKKVMELKKLWKDVVEQLRGENETLMKENADATAAAVAAQETLARAMRQFEDEKASLQLAHETEVAALHSQYNTDIHNLREQIHQAAHASRVPSPAKPSTAPQVQVEKQAPPTLLSTSGSFFRDPVEHATAVRASIQDVVIGPPLGKSESNTQKLLRRAPPPPPGASTAAHNAPSPTGSVASRFGVSKPVDVARRSQGLYTLADALAGTEPHFIRGHSSSLTSYAANGTASSLLASYLSNDSIHRLGENTTQPSNSSQTTVASSLGPPASTVSRYGHSDAATSERILHPTSSTTSMKDKKYPVAELPSSEAISNDVQNLRSRLAQDNAQIAMRLEMLRNAADNLMHKPT